VDTTTNTTIAMPADLSRRLLAWYDRHARVLPWRTVGGACPDPYRVWVSEVMLQQTTVATVEPYFHRFMERWPNVCALARASLDDVLHAWQGLGYYARARNLHACARVVAQDLGGRFPDTEEGLGALPGIGIYTAAAIAAIAFSRQAAAVDANAARVLCRLFAVEDPLPGGGARLRSLARGLVPARRPGDFAQAMMDLGATLCTPRRPACGRCPWSSACVAGRAGKAEAYPVRRPGKAKPVRRGVAFWVLRADGCLLLRRRPENGLLGGMMEVPSTDWREGDWTLAEARRQAPATARWRRVPGVVRHTFTHFHLELTVLAGRPKAVGTAGIWCPPWRLGDYALPTVMKKVARLVDQSS
jgi:A/G-specific adenine glycosylase